MTDSPMNLFPALIPVPASSQSRAPPAKTRAQMDREAEEAFAKFSTLFSPATPHASPTLGPLSLPEQPSSYPGYQMSPDSEFGAFVSVPATEDPLSLMTPGLSLPTPMQPAVRPRHLRATSESFLDQLDRGAAPKHDLLDELLMHEDDPLYWLKEQPRVPSPLPNDDDLLPSQKPNPYLTDSLSDLDFEYFASSQAKANPHRRSSSSSSYLRSPTRSPTVTVAPTLAPPLATPSTSADGASFDARASPARHAPARSTTLQDLRRQVGRLAPPPAPSTNTFCDSGGAINGPSLGATGSSLLIVNEWICSNELPALNIEFIRNVLINH
ncbi:hypothetical protein B0H15DRAFT_973521 [Mycena belliarum]|uniref:Uncharacterized protein n=1 Tax=Mycena belliarum TaxID=1033014 RepID=A0AAD6UBD1_9AGAR|nr:hypothetical protein B0H15DRAFT_973521 [Mycena belliae]